MTGNICMMLRTLTGAYILFYNNKQCICFHSMTHKLTIRLVVLSLHQEPQTFIAFHYFNEAHCASISNINKISARRIHQKGGTVPTTYRCRAKLSRVWWWKLLACWSNQEKELTSAFSFPLGRIVEPCSGDTATLQRS